MHCSPSAQEAQKQGKELPWECQPPASDAAAANGGS